MNVVKEIQRINQREVSSGSWSDSSSWHAQYKNSAWIFIGNLDYELTEGDVVCIFSQYGEVSHIEIIRDQKTGKSKGFAFLKYEDQRSTILAVDNLGGATVLGRTLRVDHSHTGPRKPKKKEGEPESDDDDDPKMNVAPQLIEVREERKPKRKESVEYDDEDPMADYFRNKKRKDDTDDEDPMADYFKNKERKDERRSSSHRHRRR